LYLLDETKYELYKISLGGRDKIPGEVVSTNKNFKLIVVSADNDGEMKPITACSEKLNGGAIAYVDGKIYSRFQRDLDSNEFAVFDANTLEFIELVQFDLQYEVGTERVYTTNILTQPKIALIAQCGYEFEIISAHLGETNVTDHIRSFLNDQKTMIIGHAKSQLGSIEETSSILELRLTIKVKQENIHLALPFTSYQNLIVTLQFAGGSMKVFNPIEDFRIINGVFSNGSGRNAEFVSLLMKYWEKFILSLSSMNNRQLDEISVADWDSIVKLYGDDPESLGNLSIRFTFHDDSEVFKIDFLGKCEWQKILDIMSKVASEKDRQYRVLLLDSVEKNVADSFLLSKVEIQDFPDDNLVNRGSLFFNGQQLQLNVFEGNSKEMLTTSWRFSFNQNGKFIGSEFAKFTEDSGNTLCASAFDLVSNYFYGITADGKNISKWKNIGSPPPIYNSATLLEAKNEIDGTIFQNYSPIQQCGEIFQIVERLITPFKTDSTDEYDFQHLRLEIRLGESNENDEVNFSIAGSPVLFGKVNNPRHSLYVVAVNDAFEVEKSKVFNLTNDSSPDQFAEFIDNLPIGKCLFVAVPDMQNPNMNNLVKSSLKLIGVPNLRNSNQLLAIGRKGLAPGTADFVYGSNEKSVTLSRILPPMIVPFSLEPTLSNLESLLSLWDFFQKKAIDASNSEASLKLLSSSLQVFAVNFKNVTSRLSKRNYLQLLDEKWVRKFEDNLNALSASPLRFNSLIQSTFTSLFLASMDLLHPNSNRKIEVLRSFLGKPDYENDCSFIVCLLRNIAQPKNYLSKSCGKYVVDKNYALHLLNILKELFHQEMKKISKSYLEENQLLCDSMSILHQTVVNAIVSLATNMMVCDYQTIELLDGKVLLNERNSLALFLEVFTFVANLSADYLEQMIKIFEDRRSKETIKKTLEYLHKDFFSFLEKAPFAKILPSMINIFIRLVQIGGYSFTTRIIDDALELVNELDRCIANMVKIVSFVPKEATKPTETVELSQMKSTIFESEHPYSSKLDEKTPISFPGAKKIIIAFDPASKTETTCDYVRFLDQGGKNLHATIADKFHGRDGDEVSIYFLI
jgi:hypothetical protein